MPGAILPSKHVTTQHGSSNLHRDDNCQFLKCMANEGGVRKETSNFRGDASGRDC